MSDGQESAEVCRWLVSGRVQGVAFRWFTARSASELGLRGTVRNLSDGRVEVLVVRPANPAALTSFRTAVETGPPASRVDAVEEADVSGAEAAAVASRRGFDIVY